MSKYFIDEEQYNKMMCGMMLKESKIHVDKINTCHLKKTICLAEGPRFSLGTIFIELLVIINKRKNQTTIR